MKVGMFINTQFPEGDDGRRAQCRNWWSRCASRATPGSRRCCFRTTT